MATQKHIFLSPSNQNANIGYGSYGNEMQRMVELCNILGPILVRCGFKVSRRDSLSPISGRTAWANGNGVDLYIPVHSNAGGGSGPIVGCHYNSANGKRAAQAIVKYLNSDMPLQNGGITTLWNFGEILNTSMPCAYIETFFHDNKTDVTWYLSGENKTVVANAIAKGVCEYMGVAFVGEGGSAPLPDVPDIGPGNWIITTDPMSSGDTKSVIAYVKAWGVDAYEITNGAVKTGPLSTGDARNTANFVAEKAVKVYAEQYVPSVDPPADDKDKEIAALKMKVAEMEKEISEMQDQVGSWQIAHAELEKALKSIKQTAGEALGN